MGGDRGPAGARFELGAYTQLYRAYPFEVALERLARAGFRSIGVSNRHAGISVISADTTMRAVEAVRRRIEGYGLTSRLVGGFPSRADEPAARLRRTVEV